MDETADKLSKVPLLRRHGIATWMDDFKGYLMGYKRAHLALETSFPKLDEAKVAELTSENLPLKLRYYEEDLKESQERWEERNDIVISRLIESTKGQDNTEAKQLIFDLYKAKKTAKEICDALLARFDSVDARVINASIKRFTSMRAAQGEKATSYITRLKEAKEHLKSKGKEFSDGELVGRLLDGLSGIEEYAMIVAALETVKNLRFDEAVEQLQTKDETMFANDDSKSYHQETAAMAMGSNRSRTSSHPQASVDTCQICTKKGHTAAKCHHRYKGNPNNNQKKWGGNNENNKKVECFKCGKIGHYARDCKHTRKMGDDEDEPPSKEEQESKRQKQNNGSAKKENGKGDWDKKDEYSGMMKESGNESDEN